MCPKYQKRPGNCMDVRSVPVAPQGRRRLSEMNRVLALLLVALGVACGCGREDGVDLASQGVPYAQEAVEAVEGAGAATVTVLPT